MSPWWVWFRSNGFWAGETGGSQTLADVEQKRFEFLNLAMLGK